MESKVMIYQGVSNPIKEAEALGLMFHESKMFGVSSHAQGAVLALECLTRQMTPSQILERYHVIEGKLSIRSDFMLAEFMRNGGEVIWKDVDKKNEFARAEFIKGKNRFVDTYSYAEALASGVCKNKSGEVKKVWLQNLPDMLRARLVSKVIRMLDPGINSGFYTPEEVSDFNQNEIEVSQSSVSGQELFTQPPKKQKKTTDKTAESDVEEAEIIEVEEKKEIDHSPEAIQMRGNCVIFTNKYKELFTVETWELLTTDFYENIDYMGKNEMKDWMQKIKKAGLDQDAKNKAGAK